MGETIKVDQIQQSYRNTRPFISWREGLPNMNLDDLKVIRKEETPLATIDAIKE